jgi:peroxiredoxin
MKVMGLLPILLLLFCVKVSSQQRTASSNEETYLITGFAHGFKDSSWLFLDDATYLGKAIDSAMVINERFYLRVKKALPKKLKSYAIRTKSFTDYKIFWTENQPLTFSGVKGNFRNSLINGSTFQQHSEAFERLTMPLIQEIDSLRRNFGNTDSLIWKKILSLEVELKEKSAQFVEENASSAISAYLLSVYCKDWGRKISLNLYNKMSLVNKNSELGLKIKKFIDINKEIEIGNIFADFEQPSPDGVQIKLSSLIDKYILLEFWASWCGPCRKENPNLVALYNKYKDRGFEIFGVSQDLSASAWKKAIAADNLTWPNVSDLKGGENEATLIYGVFEIPTNFLIDLNGKIIAKNLRGKELENKLKELLGD